MSEMMKCFVMHGIGKVGMMEKHVPRPGPSDAIIRTTAALICTSDTHTVAGAIGDRHGLTLGHEAVGVIHELGELAAASGLFKIGQRVAVSAVLCLRQLPARLSKPVRRDAQTFNHVCVALRNEEEKTMSIAVIKPYEVAELSKKGQKIDLIDVRTPVEFREVHVEFARNFPLDQLDPAALMQARNGSTDEPMYVICRSGSRGQQACEKFLEAGFSNVVNIEGGTLACVEAGLPVVRGKKAISLERQVRIAAGLLVVTGSALGYFVNPYWIGLAAFVGAGLTFAGITDTCAMGMMLARMPWNQVASSSPSSATAGSKPSDSKQCPPQSNKSCGN